MEASMKSALELIKTRRSIRKYRSEQVPESMLDQIVEAGLYAPTGMGRQQTIILKITDPQTVRSLGKLNGKLMGKEGFDAFYGAPVVLAVLSPKDIPTAVFDGCSVLTAMMYEAADLGLGSCWIHRGKEQFEEAEGKDILRKAGIDPEQYVGIDSLIVGYTEGDNPKAAPRKENRVFTIA